MLNYILFELLTTVSLRPQNEYVAKILNYIENHITEKLTLTTISNYVNLSKEYTCAIFKKEAGKSLTSYINERKALRAKDHIESSDMPLTEVAYLFGFDDYNYFSRLFKKHCGVTPVSVKKHRHS
jgi:two-component system response regulator YesN